MRVRGGVRVDGPAIAGLGPLVVHREDLHVAQAGRGQGGAQVRPDEVALLGGGEGGERPAHRLVLRGHGPDGDAQRPVCLDEPHEVLRVGRLVAAVEGAVAGLEGSAGQHPRRWRPGGGEDPDVRVDGQDLRDDRRDERGVPGDGEPGQRRVGGPVGVGVAGPLGPEVGGAHAHPQHLPVAPGRREKLFKQGAPPLRRHVAGQHVGGRVGQCRPCAQERLEGLPRADRHVPRRRRDGGKRRQFGPGQHGAQIRRRGQPQPGPGAARADGARAGVARGRAGQVRIPGGQHRGGRQRAGGHDLAPGKPCRAARVRHEGSPPPLRRPITPCHGRGARNVQLPGPLAVDDVPMARAVSSRACPGGM